MLISIFAFCIKLLGIITLALTAIGAIGSLLLYWWIELAIQGTIILTTTGISLIIVGLVLS